MTPSPFAVSPANLRPPLETMDGADWSRVKPELRDALRDAYRSSRWPVYLFGDAGRGKTWAMAAFARKVSPEPKWIDLTRFVRMVQRTRTRTEPDGRVYDLNRTYGHTEGQLWTRLVEEPTLILVDDIGIRQPSESVFEIVYELVNRRGRKPAIYTSNLGPEKLASVYDDRIASRVLGGSVLHLTGPDRRTQTTEIIEV